ncbi:MAG: hypothetical protein GF398_12100, partial [Chitinivibrionales bacterium]|nr:hypothetical protein [Chitinivibrionales bacterium]
MKSCRIIIAILLPILLGCASTTRRAFIAHGAQAELTPRSRIYLVPLTRITTRFDDRLNTAADTQFSDSFFVESGNSLLAYEIGRRFRLVNADAFRVDSTLANEPSPVPGDGEVGFDDMPALAKRLCAQHDADLLALPRECIMTHIVSQQQGWRNDQYGSNYDDKPIRYIARTKLHLQIWNKEGKLLYEKSGKGLSERPFLYSLFKRRKPGVEI